MQSLRQMLVLIFCLTLPFQGWASSAMANDPPCPMEAAGMANMTDGGADCCQDQGTADTHGKLCKTGQECRTGSWLQVGVQLPSPAMLTSLPTVVSSHDNIITPPPAGVWRPPQA